MTDPVRVPGIFDITIEPAFVRSRQVADLAGEVIAACDEFAAIESAVHEDGLVIEYVFETKPFDPAKDKLAPHVIAFVRKAPPIWFSLTGTHVVLSFRHWFWERFDDNQRRAVLHHELTHIEVEEPDDQGRIPIGLRHHDVEDFTQTMRRFGPVIPGRQAFIQAALGWVADNPETPEAIGHRIAHEVADRVNAGALGPDATATVTESTVPHIVHGRRVDPETGEIL